jgi:hypothetical protein
MEVTIKTNNNPILISITSLSTWCLFKCNQCLSPLILWVRISIGARCTTLCDKVCQWLVTDRWFSPRPPVSSTDKTDRHDITEILLKVALNIITSFFLTEILNHVFRVLSTIMIQLKAFIPITSKSFIV